MISRRRLLGYGAGLPLLGVDSLQAEKADLAVSNESMQRNSRIISGYASESIHRTATEGDRRTGRWLLEMLNELGVRSTLNEFPFERLDTIESQLEIGSMRIEGEPLYDCLSDSAWRQGRLGPLGSDAEIGVAMMPPGAGGDHYRHLTTVRRMATHRAIVVVTDDRLPAGGIAMINAEAYRTPFGPPVLQIANDRWESVREAVQQGSDARVIVNCERVSTTAANVQGKVEGSMCAWPRR